MKCLLDANLSPRVATGLCNAGIAAVHSADLGLLQAGDEEIFDLASTDGLNVVIADMDFGSLLGRRRTRRPSVVQPRHVAELTPDVHLALLAANLPAVADDLDTGAIASLSPTRLAIRALPLR